MLASKELCINKTDQESRARVTSMMIAFAKYGHIDVARLKTLAVQRRNHARIHSVKIHTFS